MHGKVRTVLRASLSTGAILALTVALPRCGGDSNFEVSEGDGRDGSASEGGPGGNSNPDGGGGDSGSSLCGNGRVDPGEECDDTNDISGDGCETDCRFSCTGESAADDCSDHVYCNGDEVCGPNHTCLPGTPREDWTECGDNRICIGGECVMAPSDCGDGIVGAEEQCEDDNDVDGDGCDSDCRFSCWLGEGERRPCSQDNLCAGFPTCDPESHVCVRGNPLSDGSPCEIAGEEGECVDGQCSAEFCGNGKVESGEQCDDKNNVDDDGCNNECVYTCDENADCARANPCVTSQCEDHVCTPRAPRDNGTTCGDDKVCVSSICRVSACRDGALDPRTEECDDGNNIEGDGCDNDCEFTCEQASDCEGGSREPPICRTWDCENHRCVSVPDSEQEGDACPATKGGSPTCKNGACTDSVCGDGGLDDGEQCDLGTARNGPGTGCESYCRFSCNDNADCDNGEECDGVETCQELLLPDPVKVCRPTEPIANGTQCGGTEEEICIDGVCRVGFCGDGYADESMGEECDPPNEPACTDTCSANEICDVSGLWAQRVEVDVTWPGTIAIEGGQGVINQWALMEVGQSGTSLNIQFKVCGLTIPDFRTTETFESELFGIAFPNSIFDAGSVPIANGTGTVGLSPGSVFSAASAAFQLGIELNTPFGPWPQALGDVPQNQLADHDGEGHLGIRARTKTGSDYSNIALTVFGDEDPRADRVDLVIRQIASVTGTLKTCETMSGEANVTSIDNHIIGCHEVTEDRDCKLDEYRLIDGFRPQYTPSAASWEGKRVPDDATCETVRKTFP